MTKSQSKYLFSKYGWSLIRMIDHMYLKQTQPLQTNKYKILFADPMAVKKLTKRAGGVLDC
jgi:hypothetical protein